ncbi:MAG: GNAT family N-acetyltransferase [Sphaerobacter sp.]|nr:GNAT family N-acetyltransferase [Sphaerobacter sp.]
MEPTEMAKLTLRRYDSASLGEIFERLVDIYAEVYADHLDDPFFAVDRFAERLRAHARAPGYELVLGEVASEPVGYIYGYPLGPGSRWWQGVTTPVDSGLLTEHAGRTFAICELMVRPAWQGKGFARRLHDALLGKRREERATLLVEQDNEHARGIYERWGYRKVAEVRPSWPDAPTLDALILPLRTG